MSAPFRLFLQLLLLLLWNLGEASVVVDQCRPMILWEEVVEAETALGEEEGKGQASNKKRQIFAWRSKEKPLTSAPKIASPHPLRMQEFQLRIRWKEREWKKIFGPSTCFEFSPNGRVRVSPSSKHTHHIGEWDFSAGGLCFKVPVSEATTGSDKVLVFTADLHANPFGAYPKLSRGVILQEERRSFGFLRVRRILGTFVGRGVGEDSFDLSYRDRG